MSNRNYIYNSRKEVIGEIVNDRIRYYALAGVTYEERGKGKDRHLIIDHTRTDTKEETTEFPTPHNDLRPDISHWSLSQIMDRGLRNRRIRR